MLNFFSNLMGGNKENATHNHRAPSGAAPQGLKATQPTKAEAIKSLEVPLPRVCMPPCSAPTAIEFGAEPSRREQYPPSIVCSKHFPKKIQ